MEWLIGKVNNINLKGLDRLWRLIKPKEEQMNWDQIALDHLYHDVYEMLGLSFKEYFRFDYTPFMSKRFYNFIRMAGE